MIAKVVAALLALAASCSSASATEPAEDAAPVLTIIGDSIAVDAASDPESWASVTASASGLEMRNYSASGTGIVKGGAVDGVPCTVGSFPTRVGRVAEDRPELVIVEDAVGNALRCSNGVYVAASQKQVRDLTDRFMRELAIEVSALGLPRDHVIVMSPTSHKVRNCEWMRDLMETAAARHGFTFIAPYLTVNQTVDGIHPNAAGQRVLTDAVASVLPAP